MIRQCLWSIWTDTAAVFPLIQTAVYGKVGRNVEQREYISDIAYKDEWILHEIKEYSLMYMEDADEKLYNDDQFSDRRTFTISATNRYVVGSTTTTPCE